MRFAITDHAVDRYQQRVRGAYSLTKEEVRNAIRNHITDAAKHNLIKNHPSEKDQKLAPFLKGSDVFYVCIAPNTTNYPGNKAVVSVIHGRELGETGMGVTLGDKFPKLKELVVEPRKTQSTPLSRPAATSSYQFVIRTKEKGDIYFAVDEEALLNVLKLKELKPEQVYLYCLQERFRLRTTIEIEE